MKKDLDLGVKACALGPNPRRRPPDPGHVRGQLQDTLIIQYGRAEVDHTQFHLLHPVVVQGGVQFILTVGQGQILERR